MRMSSAFQAGVEASKRPDAEPKNPYKTRSPQYAERVDGFMHRRGTGVTIQRGDRDND